MCSFDTKHLQFIIMVNVYERKILLKFTKEKYCKNLLKKNIAKICKQRYRYAGIQEMVDGVQLNRD